MMLLLPLRRQFEPPKAANFANFYVFLHYQNKVLKFEKTFHIV